MPTYTHDCPNCKFLGQFSWQDEKGDIHNRDIYLCRTKRNVTIISRYGNEGSEYYSTPVDIQSVSLIDPGFNAGVVTALKRGLVRPGEITDPLN
jgi:hypothetical protein